jgi:predicted sulfurtransferase
MLRKKIEQMDIDFLSSGGHKIGLDKFLELWSKGEAIMLDVRLEEEVELCRFGFGINIPLHNFLKILTGYLVINLLLFSVMKK